MRRIAMTLVLTAVFAFPAFAQNGPCTEEFIKAESSKPDPKPQTDDLYFFSGAIEKPVIGGAEIRKTTESVRAQRKNMKADPEKPDRIVAALSGDMAYEYGTRDISFDETGSGKHHEFTTAYLRVWKNDNGSSVCEAVLTILSSPGGKKTAQAAAIPTPSIPS